MRRILACLLCLTPASATAQQAPCGPTGMVEKRLNKEYGETVAAAGFAPGGVLFIISNPKTQSFTVLLRRPDGQTCIVFGGHGFTTIEPVKPGVDL